MGKVHNRLICYLVYCYWFVWFIGYFYICGVVVVWMGRIYSQQQKLKKKEKPE